MTILRAIMDMLGRLPESWKASSTPADITAIMDAKVAASGLDLDWRHSVVDTLKALNMPSDHSARRELADELGMPNVEVGSAVGNERLRLELMRHIAENGGNVPEELR